jgi:hypothetical protein
LKVLVKLGHKRHVFFVVTFTLSEARFTQKIILYQLLITVSNMRKCDFKQKAFGVVWHAWSVS